MTLPPDPTQFLAHGKAHEPRHKANLANQLNCKHFLGRVIPSAAHKFDTILALTKPYNSSILLQHFYILTCLFDKTVQNILFK